MSIKYILKVIVSLLVCYIGNTHGLNINEQCTKLLTAFPPDPETSCCGQDASGQQKIIGGIETFIEQYPWLVLLEYSKDGGPIKTRCGGALISGRYVLTAGHCVAGPHIMSVGGPPKTVRLGEFDTSSDGVDCVDVEAGGLDCNEGTVTIPIEEIIVHPEYERQYNNSKLIFKHNIALIGLKELAPFTDFIRPICLPTTDAITTNQSDYLPLTEAGWGTRPPSSRKFHQTLKFVDKNTCEEGFKINNITLDDTQFCAGAGVDHNCTGSSGGPLMLKGSKSYEVVGVDSFAPIPCGSDGLPTVYTKIFAYMDWIKRVINIRERYPSV